MMSRTRASKSRHALMNWRKRLAGVADGVEPRNEDFEPVVETAKHAFLPRTCAAPTALFPVRVWSPALTARAQCFRASGSIHRTKSCGGGTFERYFHWLLLLVRIFRGDGD